MLALALASVAIVSAAPAFPLPYLFAAQLVVGSGRWAGLPPVGLGLTGLITSALVLKVVFLAATRSSSPELAPPGGPHRPARSVAVAAGAFSVVLAVSLAWSPSAAYGAEKLCRLVAFNLVPAWLLWFALRAGYMALDRFLAAVRLSLLLVVATGLLGVVAGGAQEVSRVSVGRTDPIAFGALAAAGALLWYERLLAVSGRPRARAAWATVVCIAAVLGSNSKGPALALILSVVVTHVVLGRARPGLRSFTGRLRLAVVPLAVMGLLFLLVPARFVSRIDPAVLATAGKQPGFSESFSLRHRLQHHALSMLAERPVTGTGLGGFNTVEETAYVDRLPSGGLTVLYPHNLPLEVAAETGLVVLTALVVLAGVIWSVLRSPAPRPDGAALVVLAAISALFSGDLSDNRVLWYGLAIHLHLVWASSVRLARPAPASAAPASALGGR